MAFNRSFPIVDSHNELHEKDILWTEENLQTSNAFGAENTVETLEPPKKEITCGKCPVTSHKRPVINLCNGPFIGFY